MQDSRKEMHHLRLQSKMQKPAPCPNPSIISTIGHLILLQSK
jgi:hypothetical protein